MTETKSIQAGERAQHTPGPWKWYGEAMMSDLGSSALHPSISGEITSANGQEIIMSGAFGGVHGGSLEEVEANARLIAAAPELLAALKAVVSHGEGMPGWTAAQDQAAAAIAKSEGR